jgi:DNA polymerase-3 subunit gamma/tau
MPVPHLIDCEIMGYLVLARKWRPRGFDDLVGQEPIMRILKNAISQGKIAHAYIFSGPRGVGKTSSARILAKALNCKDGPTPAPCGVCETCTAISDGSSVDVIEIDGASNNSVDDIRDLRERVKYAPSGGRYKVYIIDEVHMLSSSAFNALLKTLEEPPAHVIFVLATTEMKKIPATVLSRCQHMPFRRISSSVIKTRLKDISDAEGIRISPPALGLVAKAAEGSMRDSLTILDQISSFSAEITEEDVKNLLGITDFGLLADISKALIIGDRVRILETVDLLAEQGTDIRAFSKELVQFFRDLLVASVMRNPGEVLDLSPEEIAAVMDIVSTTSEDQLTLMLSEIMKSESDVRNSSSPRLAFEMTLIRASFLSAVKPLKEVIENIDRFRGQAGGAAPEKPERSLKEKEERSRPAAGASEVKRKEMPHDSLPPAASPAKSAGKKETIETNPSVKKEKEPEETSGVPEGPVTEEKAPETSGAEKDIWERTIARVEPPLASKLVHAAAELKGDELFLTLNGGQAVFEESIKSNLKTLEKIASEEAGRRLRIKLTTAHKKSVRKRDLKEKVLEEPLIREALELFEGRIVDVTPVDGSENIQNGGDHV